MVSQHDARTLLSAVIGQPADHAFAAECHDLTGGNRRLLTALAEDLRAFGPPVPSRNVAAMAALHGRCFARAVHDLLAPMGDASRLPAEVLRQAGLLRPAPDTSFRHPLTAGLLRGEPVAEVTLAGLALARCEFPGDAAVPPAPAPGSWAGLGVADPMTAAAEALCGSLAGLPGYEIVPRAEHALAGLELGPRTLLGAVAAVRALLLTDRLGLAVHWSRVLCGRAGEAGQEGWQGEFMALEAVALYRLGQIRPARVLTRTALARSAPEALSLPVLIAAALVDPYALAGREPPPPTSLAWAYHLWAGGCRHLDAGRPAEALADFEQCGRALTRWRADQPAVIPWRTSAAVALAATGSRRAALGLALEEVRLARATLAPVVLGAGLRVAATVADLPFRLELLRESERLLTSTGARLELARTLHDIGVQSRHEGDLEGAHTAMTEALDHACDCGATALERDIRATLRDLGGPGRSDRLTAGQRRVAELAVAGRSNRDIAAELSVTLSTVEQHLTQVYRRLGVCGRAQLDQVAGLLSG